MTLASTAALQTDLRFRGAPLELRGLYRMLLDFQNACGDVTARGLSGLAAAAAALGCSTNEARGLLVRLEGHGLLRVEPQRVCLLVGSRRGREGGMSGAERVQRARAKASGGSDVTVGNGQVTEEARKTIDDSENRNESSVRVLEPVSGADSSPLSASSPSPLTLSSLSSPTSSPSVPAGGVGSTPSVQPTGGASTKQPNLFGDEDKPKAQPVTGGASTKQPNLFGDEDKPKAQPVTVAKPRRRRKADAPEPLPFKLGEALDALAAAAAGRVVRGEGRDITQAIAVQLVAQIRAYPTLAEWSLVGAWLADGALAHRGTLGPSWVASAAFREAMALARDWAAKNRPAANAPAPRLDGRHRPQPAPDPRRGIQPPAPASAYDHKRLAHLLGVKWPGWSPGIETLAQAFQRICGVSLDEARQRFPLDPTASAAPRTP